MLLLDFILINYKQLENVNKNYKDLKAKIDYRALKTMLQHICPSFFLLTLKIENINDVAILLEYKNSIKLVYANSYKKSYYPILANFIVDYKEQVWIINIKINM